MDRVSIRKEFSMGINCMSLTMWFGEDRKCSAAAVGLDLSLGLPMVRGVHEIGLLIVVSFPQYIVNYSSYRH